jgi:hypothetical protein
MRYFMSIKPDSCYFPGGSRIVCNAGNDLRPAPEAFGPVELIVNAVNPNAAARGARCMLLAAVALLGGCSHMQALWPWHQKPPPPEPVVHELVVEAGAGASAPAISQTWDRNALRVALTGVAGEGELRLRPARGHEWPIRLEFAVQPGAFAHLEVRGEQRVIMSVPATGGVAILQVPLGIYAPATSELTLRYGS